MLSSTNISNLRISSLSLEGRGQIFLMNVMNLENLGEGDSSQTPHPNPLPQGERELGVR
jgi:hypothetical protein